MKKFSFSRSYATSHTPFLFIRCWNQRVNQQSLAHLMHFLFCALLSFSYEYPLTLWESSQKAQDKKCIRWGFQQIMSTMRIPLMIQKQRGTTSWYEFELLQPFPYLRHGCFVSLNVAPSSQGDEDAVQENRRLITTALFEPSHSSLVEMKQVHGVDISIVSSPASPINTCDGIATSLPHIGLLVKHADCQGCLLFDPEHRVIAAVHCGWKGSVQNIYKAAVERLKSEWGTREEALIACIGPSLGPCHAEFTNWKEELPPSFESFRRGEHHFDFWEISRHQLLSCGISPSHIEIARICTCCHPELFFSYRRDKTSQRNATCIAIV